MRWQLETPAWLGLCLRTTIEQEYVPPCSVRARVVVNMAVVEAIGSRTCS